jgi:hypothetical protein
MSVYFGWLSVNGGFVFVNVTVVLPDLAYLFVPG